MSCIFLHLPFTTGRSLVYDREEEKRVHEISETSLTMLDACGTSKDVLFRLKEHLQGLQFTLRRAGVSKQNTTKNITAYKHHRKTLKKAALDCSIALKGITNSKPVSMDDNLMEVVEVLREVRVGTVCVIESLLALISTPWLERRWDKRTRKVHDIGNKTVEKSENERLEEVEISIEEVEVELEFIYKRLIQARVLLLNLLTCH